MYEETEYRCEKCDGEMEWRTIDVTPPLERKRLMNQFRNSAGRRYQEERGEGPEDFGTYAEAWVCEECGHTEGMIA